MFRILQRPGLSPGTIRWAAGLSSGLVAGLLFGLMIDLRMGIMPVLGALYGLPNAIAGWGVHLVHSLAFALAFVILLGTRAFNEEEIGPFSGAAIGVAYGLVIWVLAAVILMPVWLSQVGFPGPSVPNLNADGLLGHVLFGGILGGGYRVPSRTFGLLRRATPRL